MDSCISTSLNRGRGRGANQVQNPVQTEDNPGLRDEENPVARGERDPDLVFLPVPPDNRSLWDHNNPHQNMSGDNPGKSDDAQTNRLENRSGDQHGLGDEDTNPIPRDEDIKPNPPPDSDSDSDDVTSILKPFVRI
jgi:hypothetical protein